MRQSYEPYDKDAQGRWLYLMPDGTIVNDEGLPTKWRDNRKGIGTRRRDQRGQFTHIYVSCSTCRMNRPAIYRHDADEILCDDCYNGWLQREGAESYVPYKD